MEFVAIDVETANSNVSSICQIGLAVFRNGQLVKEWKTYIDPEGCFSGINVSIHGIDENTVKGAPTIPDISNKLYRFMDDRVSVCHTHFDRVAIQQAFDKYKLRHPNCRWLSSARVARRTWAKFAKRGYGLGKICAFLGYDFTPHDALEDAKAAAYILNTAIEKTSLDIEGWLRCVKQPICSSGTDRARNKTQ